MELKTNQTTAEPQATAATMGAREHLELFMYRIKVLREAQRAAKKTNTTSNVKKAAQLEEQADKALQALQALGYNSDRFQPAAPQILNL